MNSNFDLERNLKNKFFLEHSSPIIINSRFSVLFPKYQEKNLTEKWFIIQRILRFHGIKSTLDLKKGSIEISTTFKTADPYAIIDGKDFLRLLARGVPIHQAAKIFNGHVFCDIIKISSFTKNKKLFLKRRKRIVGKNGSTIKIIELLTKSFILVQGNTVSCIGNFKNIKLCRKIIEDCMQNIHPFIHIRNLTIKKKLLKSNELKNKSWSDFLPLELIKPKLITAKILKINGKKIENRETKTVENYGRDRDFLKKCLETRKDFKFKFKTLKFQ